MLEHTKLDHPFFSYYTKGHHVPIVFVFNKPMRSEPDPEKIEEYERCKAIVEKHHGYMRQSQYEFTCTEQPRFTEVDVQELIKLVQKKFPRFKLLEHWNGVGCYTLSIGGEGKV